VALALNMNVEASFAQWPMSVLEWQGAEDPSVLVADDDEGVRDLISVKLENAGYRVITAENGSTALDLVLRERPDAVILDVSMPGRDGLSVCHEMHSTADTARIPVLMVSGRTGRADINLGYTAGADDYLVKPFKPADLLRRLRLLLLAGH
jgi:DNA-binding response OmpR family regulator